MGSQGLQVSSDFVANVSCCRCPIGANDAQINETVLHKVPAGIVYNDGMRNAVFSPTPKR